MKGRSCVAIGAGLIAIAMAGPIRAEAQRVESSVGIGVSRHSLLGTRGTDSANPVAQPTHVNDAVYIRAFSAAGGLLAGAFVGGYVGAHTGGTCSCDDPGLEELLFGVLSGVVVGTPLGAAAPDLGSVCTFAERFGRSLVGSAAGGLVGLLATRGAGNGILLLPAFSLGGGLATLGRCWKSGPG